MGKTLFVIHHDLNNVENYFDWTLLLNLRLIACGKTQEVFTPNNLYLAYGKSFSLFDEALKISRHKETGLG